MTLMSEVTVASPASSNPPGVVEVFAWLQRPDGSAGRSVPLRPGNVTPSTASTVESLEPPSCFVSGSNVSLLYSLCPLCWLSSLLCFVLQKILFTSDCFSCFMRFIPEMSRQFITISGWLILTQQLIIVVIFAGSSLTNVRIYFHIDVNWVTLCFFSCWSN